MVEREPQADLFGAPKAKGDSQEIALHRGRGRPKGAQNLSTKRYTAWLRSYLGDPLLPAARIAVLDITDPETVKELARRWSCTKLEAVDRWSKINAGVLPYFHQQQPRAIHLSPGDPTANDDDAEEIAFPRLRPLPGDDAKDITPEP